MIILREFQHMLQLLMIALARFTVQIGSGRVGQAHEAAPTTELDDSLAFSWLS